MVDKYQNKYRIPSARAAWWDYGDDAAYFVTLCTHKRVHYFGTIQRGDMHLSDIGQAAYACWDAIPDHFPFVRLDAFVVMPNHVHGILIIDKRGRGMADIRGKRGRTIADIPIETQNLASLRPPHAIDQPPQFRSPDATGQSPRRTHVPNQPKNKFAPQSKNLASIIRGYKIGVTKYARTHNLDFAWQPRFHDHIIRNTRAYRNISRYIINNPKNWQADTFHKRPSSDA